MWIQSDRLSARVGKRSSLACGTVLVVAAALAGVLLTTPVWSADAGPARTGDQHLTYAFAPTGEQLPYRIYVPADWRSDRKMPLLVLLHGGNLDENSAFDREPPELKGELFRLADRYGFILVAPLGYSKSGGYGYVAIPGAPGSPFPATAKLDPNLVGRTPDEAARLASLSEQDTLAVVDIVAARYHADRSRLFIMGNSMGGFGTMHLITAHPELWRAAEASEGGFNPLAFADRLDALRIKGLLIVKKEDSVERTAQAEETSRLVRARGIASEVIVVPDSKHETAWYIALPKTFAFFARLVR